MAFRTLQVSDFRSKLFRQNTGLFGSIPVRGEISMPSRPGEDSPHYLLCSKNRNGSTFSSTRTGNGDNGREYYDVQAKTTDYLSTRIDGSKSAKMLRQGMNLSWERFWPRPSRDRRPTP